MIDCLKNGTFSTSREIPASPQAIFDAISNPDKLARWWGPDGFTNTFNVFEFRNNGKWSFVMHGPDGMNYPNENRFIDIIAPEKVVIEHVSEPRFTLTITLSPSGNGTSVNWVQVFESENVARKVAAIVEPANEQNLDRLTMIVCQR